LVNGEFVKLATSCAVPGGLTAAAKYFIVGVCGNDFQVSLTSGGSAIALSTTGTGNQTFTVTEEQIQAYLCSGAEKVVTDTNTLALSKKTLTSPVLNGCLSGTAFLDDDCFTANSATKVASQQSIKAYIAAQLTNETLCYTDDCCTACLAIDLDSESLKIAGAAGVSTAGSANTLTVTVDHDGICNFVANEHINHACVCIATGAGLSGGGTIASSRTLVVCIACQGAVTAPVTADELLFNDISACACAGAIKKATLANISKGIDHDAALNFVADEHVLHACVCIVAGTGMTGGGNISCTRTLNVIGGSNITANANCIALCSTLTCITLTAPVVGTSVLLDSTCIACTQTAAELRFEERTGACSNYVGFKAPDSVAANVIWTLPAADGSCGQVLTTCGCCNLSWSSVSSCLTIAGDVGCNDVVNLASDTFTHAGGTGLTSTVSNNQISYAIDCTVATLTGCQILINKTFRANDGAVCAPTLSFDADTDTGFYRSTCNELSVAMGGTQAAKFNSTGMTVTNGQLVYPIGSAGAPGLSPVGFSNYGFVTVTNAMRQYLNGNLKWTTGNSSNTSHIKLLVANNCDSATVPTIARSGDGTTGLGFNGNTLENVALYSNSNIGLLQTASKVAIQNSRDLHIEGAKELRFEDTTGGQYMGFKAPGTVTASRTFTLPDGDGSCGQALVTNGCQTLSWASVEGSNKTVVTKTGAYTVLITDDVVLANAACGAFTLTLPTAACNSGKVFEIQKTDSNWSNAVTVDGNACETVGGVATFLLYTTGEKIRIISDGSNWTILDHNRDTGFEDQACPGGLFTNFTVGNATMVYKKRRVANNMELMVSIVLGSTSSACGTLRFELPNCLNFPTYINSSVWRGALGQGHILDSGTTQIPVMVGPTVGATDDFVLYPVRRPGTTYADIDSVATATLPIATLATGDSFNFVMSVPIDEWEQ
jgi:hypothetical protein